MLANQSSTRVFSSVVRLQAVINGIRPRGLLIYCRARLNLAGVEKGVAQVPKHPTIHALFCDVFSSIL